MKNCVWCVVVLLLLLCCSSCSFDRKVRVSVEVRDRDGLPVDGADVRVSFIYFEEDSKSARVEGRTDKRGSVVLTGYGRTAASVLVTKDGYYDSAKAVDLYQGDDMGYSRPVDPQVSIVLKKIKNPVSTFARGNNIRLLLPALSEPVGFDLFKNDWVRPYGLGVNADIVFEYSGHVEIGNVDAALVTSIEEGGFSRFEMGTNGSALASDYVAPLDVSKYSSILLHQKVQRTENEIMENDSSYREGIGYYLLLRPRFDSEGRLVAAFYGKMYGDFKFNPTMSGKCEVQFSAYFINPTPNDRNVEAKVGASLIEGLDRDEIPTRP